MAELLFELGCEELPATFVRRAVAQLEAEIVRRLDEAGIAHGESDTKGTPRRLIVAIDDVVDRQPDRSQEVRGPALKSAYTADGQPSPALLGFCRGQGVDPAQVRPEGDYVFATKLIPGRPTAEVLAEIFPETVRSLTFDKSMRWGTSRMRFARPIRWFVALFAGAVVPFSVEGVASGNESRGHRFYAPANFAVDSYETLVSGLRERFVEPCAVRREAMIRQGALACATGSPELTDSLVDENVFLTEWPMPLEGQFPPEFMSLPEPVLITAMAKHERFFPVRGEDGHLVNRFVSVRNAGEEDAVRAGNQWVLNARFNDARFFYQEDARRTMDDFLAATERMLFQDKLGTVRQRADRLSQLAAARALEESAPAEDVLSARRAGLYAKADLTTGLVSELPSLQGVIGGAYATRDGLAPDVAEALALQYDIAQCRALATPGQRTGLRVLVADQLDKLAGYLGIGLAPTGSSDPYGLRRAVTLLIEAVDAGQPGTPGYAESFECAIRAFTDQGIALNADAVRKTLTELFTARYAALREDVRYDVREAVLSGVSWPDLTNPRRMRVRFDAAMILGVDTGFVQAATRPLKILSAAEKKEGTVERAVDATQLDSAEGARLLASVQGAVSAISAALPQEDAPAVAHALHGLAGPIHAYFEATMIMAEAPAMRAARLGVVAQTADALNQVADFTRIVVEG